MGTIGISVDTRRKNRSEEGFTTNVDRLKSYLSKVIVLSKKEISKRKKANDMANFSADNTVRKMAGVSQKDAPLEIKNLGALGDSDAYATLRHFRNEVRLQGARDKAAKEAA